MANGKYRLTTAHYFPGDLFLPEGTIVGEGTEYPVQGPPSLNMEPLDDQAVEEIKRWNDSRSRPNPPVLVANPTGAYLVPGPGQKVLTDQPSGPPRNPGGSAWDRGAPVRGGTTIAQSLTPTEEKIQEERAEMDQELLEKQVEAGKAAQVRLEEARARAREASGIDPTEQARKAEADKKAAEAAEDDAKAAKAKAAKDAAQAPAREAQRQGSPLPSTGGKGPVSPAPAPKLENSLPKPG